MMPFYMVQFKYSQAALKAMIAKPQDRTAAAKHIVEDFGGTLHAFYMSFGEYDGLAIAEYPDTASATASLMALNAAGGVTSSTTTALISPEEAVSAMRMAGAAGSGYRPPQA